MLASLQALFDQNVSTPDPWSTGCCRHRSGSGGACCKPPSCPRCYTRSSWTSPSNRWRTCQSTRSGKGHPVGILAYADHLALISAPHEHANSMLRLCEAYAAKNAFQLAPAKCKYLSGTEGPLCLYGQPLGRAQSFDPEGINTDAHIAPSPPG